MSEYKSGDAEVEVDEVFEPYLTQETEAENEVYEVSEEELDSAYNSAVLDLHPDQGGHEELFKRMNNSYEELEEEISGSIVVTREEFSSSNRPYENSEPDYEVNEDGFISAMDEMIEEIQETRKDIENQMDEVVQDELDAMERIAEGETDLDEATSDNFPF